MFEPFCLFLVLKYHYKCLTLRNTNEKNELELHCVDSAHIVRLVNNILVYQIDTYVRFVTLNLNTSQLLVSFESKNCHRHNADRLSMKYC